MQKFKIEQGKEGKERKNEGKVRESTVWKWEDPENEDTGDGKKRRGEECSKGRVATRSRGEREESGRFSSYLPLVVYLLW